MPAEDLPSAPRDERDVASASHEGAVGLPLRINIVTIFPEFFAGPLGISIPSKAAAAGSVVYNVVDLRSFTHDKHRTVDDYPYGGGPGMVMKPEPWGEAIDATLAQISNVFIQGPLL